MAMWASHICVHLNLELDLIGGKTSRELLGTITENSSHLLYYFATPGQKVSKNVLQLVIMGE